MSGVATAAVAGAVINGVVQNQAAGDAAGAAGDASDAAIAQQMMAMDKLSKWLKPYRKAGELALGGGLDLLGLNGEQSQASAISALEKSPQFTALVKQGENALLQNASATGGLRGGNTAAALAEFRPQMLSDIIERQYAKLGGLMQLGQNSAAQVGTSGLQSASQVGGILADQGMNNAMGIMAQGQGYADMIAGLTKGAGILANRTGVI